MENKGIRKSVDAVSVGLRTALTAYNRLPKAQNLNDVYENAIAAGVVGVTNFSVFAFENNPKELQIPQDGRGAKPQNHPKRAA